MQLLYCDETNLVERSGDFLIYGGLIIEGDTAKDFSIAVDNLRVRHGVSRDHQLKFNPGPVGFNHQQFIALKQEILELATKFRAKLLVYVILHDIASNPDTARRNGINTICYNFDCILKREAAAGLVLIDRFNDAGNAIDLHLRNKFSVGVTGLPFNDEVRLENIVGFHYSAIGQSHFPSIVDIALGSLRMAINAHTRRDTKLLPTANKVLGLLSPLFWRKESGKHIPEHGFIFSPKLVKVQKYKAVYVDLKEFLASAGIETLQKITNESSEGF